jgi:RNA polymerase sigma-70 factor (ECF subfamily)
MHEHSQPLIDLAVTLDRALEEEFEARLAESSRLVFRVAYSVLRHREDAEDVAQEAFAKSYRAFRQLRDRERFRAWVVRMTFRMALDRQRANRRRAAREQDRDDLVPLVATASAAHDERERAEQLWRAIDGLSEKLRRVVVLASIEGHNLREVGTLLGLPEGTVKSRLFLARQELKERLSWTTQTKRP